MADTAEVLNQISEQLTEIKATQREHTARLASIQRTQATHSGQLDALEANQKIILDLLRPADLKAL